MIITGSIDVTKIDKARLYKGEKGTYLNFKIMVRDEQDKYGNDGFIAESVSKEEREAGQKGTILGNIRIVAGKQSEPAPEAPAADDDLPF